MKNKKVLLKLMAIVLTVMILQTLLMYTFAEENLPVQLSELSPWAIEEVNMARLYSLASEGMLNDFKREITKEELSYLGANLYAKLTDNLDNEEVRFNYHTQLLEDVWDGNYEPKKLGTREEVAMVLYNVIRASAPELNLTEDSTTVISFLVDHGIIIGRGDNSLDLKSYATRQELFALLKRTYEFVIHETDRASKGYFYKLSGGKSDVYILGSIHIADISIYPLHRSIEAAFKKADYVAVEADVNNMEEAATYMQQKALYFDGTTIDTIISPETYELYREKMETYGFEQGIYNILKPWYAAMLIQNLSLQEGSYSAGLGIDLYFLTRTIDKGILEVEGIPFQVDLFDNFSAEIQENYLVDVLLSTQSNSEEESLSSEVMKYMLSVWKQGDAEELARLITSTDDSDEANEFEQLFWVERNKNMTQKIIEYLNDENEKIYFVIVGAGHLVGKTGVVNELIELGYSLEKITK